MGLPVAAATFLTDATTRSRSSWTPCEKFYPRDIHSRVHKPPYHRLVEACRTEGADYFRRVPCIRLLAVVPHASCMRDAFPVSYMFRSPEKIFKRKYAACVTKRSSSGENTVPDLGQHAGQVAREDSHSAEPR